MVFFFLVLCVVFVICADGCVVCLFVGAWIMLLLRRILGLECSSSRLSIVLGLYGRTNVASFLRLYLPETFSPSSLATSRAYGECTQHPTKHPFSFRLFLSTPRRYEMTYRPIVLAERWMDFQAQMVILRAWVRGLVLVGGFAGAHQAAAGLV